MTLASTQLTPTHGSSGAYFDVSPDNAMSELEDFIDDFESVFEDAIESTLAHARSEIRAQAEQDSDWKEYADLLEVEYVDGSFHYVLVGDEDRVQEALDLEYGALGRSPHSIMRKNANNNGMSDVLTNEIAQEVPYA